MGNVSHYTEETITAYVGCLLSLGFDYSEVCEDDEETCAYDHKYCELNPASIGETYDETDITAEAMSEIRNDVMQFLDLVWEEVPGAYTLDANTMGHNFALTRNGHGTGFWDLDLGVLGDELTTWSKTFGEQELHVGDDRKLYV